MIEQELREQITEIMAIHNTDIVQNGIKHSKHPSELADQIMSLLEAENAALKAEIEEWRGNAYKAQARADTVTRLYDNAKAEIAKLRRIAQDDADVIGGKG